ncbi:MAG: sugar phosphate isomerase/epimerase [Acuticoccus sp.]
MLRFAYNTIGCANHALFDALDLISGAGYQGVVLTLDVHHMNPFADDFAANAERLAGELARADLAVTIDTGARFLLDPRERYEPSLLHPSEEGRARRIEFMTRAIDLAATLNAEAVTFTAGRVKRNVDQGAAAGWLLDGLARIADLAADKGVRVALQPSPGHLVATLDDFKLVRDAARQMTDASLDLSLDVTHVAATGERSPHQAVKEFATMLRAVSLSGAERGGQAHLPPGRGDLDIVAVLGALRDVDYEGLISVKLPELSHHADEHIPASIDWLLDNLPSD